MNKITSTLFQTGEQEIFEDIFEDFNSSSFNFFYKKDDNEYKLKSMKSNNNVILKSEDGSWECEKDGLIIMFEGTIIDVTKIFSGENKLAPYNSEVAISIFWECRATKKRGNSKLIPIKSNSRNERINILLELDPSQISKSMSFSLIITISKPTKYNKEKRLSNTKGTIIAKSRIYELILRGTGSDFPIYEINDEREPLWQFSTAFSDPREDKFLDGIKILINRSHEDFQFIDHQNISPKSNKESKFSEGFMLEIFSQCIFRLMLEIKEEHSEIFSDSIEDFEIDSVAYSILYIKEELGLNTTASTQDLFDSINKAFGDIRRRK